METQENVTADGGSSHSPLSSVTLVMSCHRDTRDGGDRAWCPGDGVASVTSTDSGAPCLIPALLPGDRLRVSSAR